MTKGKFFKQKGSVKALLGNQKHKLEEEQRKIRERISDLYSPSSLSSSSSSSTATESIHSCAYIEEEEETVKKKFETLYNSSDLSTDDEEGQEEEHLYFNVKSYAEKTDFFENFINVPDIENISEDVSVASVAEQEELPHKVTSKDMGHFVDHITGLELHSRSPTIIVEDTELRSSETERKSENPSESQTETESQLSEYNDLVLPENIPLEDARNTTYEMVEGEKPKDIFDMFYELGSVKVEKVAEDINWEAVIKAQETEKLQQHILEFINELIYNAVEVVELITPNTLLKKSLDKRKLIMEILQKCSQFDAETKYSELLQRKIVEFFKRKKSYRSILPDNNKTLSKDKEKYKKALHRLDEQLAKESTIAVLSTKDSLEKQILESKRKVDNEIQSFENLVRNTFARDIRSQPNALIEQLLLKMCKYRNEVSELRFQMITKQHTHAILMKKLAKFEDLGSGLTIKHYDHIHHVNQTLDKKIEERNTDLKKLHLRTRNCIHILAHYKEKQRMLRDVIETQRSYLENLLDERRYLRRHIYGLKLQHSRIRQEINDLSFKGGLVDKPLLMHDYDQTVERLNGKRELIARLRITLATIYQRINRLERRLTGNTVTSLIK